jgi:hypothetical protein
MNNNINTVDVLAEFYKHCLNVAGDVRPNNKNSPLWSGWMRCYITPYLVRGKVINKIHPFFREVMGDDFCKFKNRLLYTLQDYIDFSSINYKNDDTNIKTQNLILNLEQMEENEIINMIETNKDKFLSKTDCNNENIIDENYNDKFK